MKQQIDIKQLVYDTIIDFLQETNPEWMDYDGESCFPIYDPELDEMIYVDQIYLDGKGNLCFKEKKAHFAHHAIWYWDDIPEMNYATIYNEIYNLKHLIDNGKVSNS